MIILSLIICLFNTQFDMVKIIERINLLKKSF